MADPTDLDSAIEELYGLEPGSFTARRDAIAAAARKAGDRDLASAVKALRRPSAAAHAVNRLARHSGTDLVQLVSLGEKLRVAQESLSAGDLRALGRQRSQLVAQMARQAAGLVRSGGSTISESAVREVESTLEAAMGDPAASAAVTSGNLVRALARTGLDAADLEGAVAGDRRSGPSKRADRTVEPTPARAKAKASSDTDAEEQAKAKARAQALAVARSERDAAAERLGQTRRAAEEARHLLAGATAGRDQADARVEELTRELAGARKVADDAEEQQRQARRRTADAESDTEEAKRALDRAEAELGGLEAEAG